jgi:hypothetical protein
MARKLPHYTPYDGSATPFSIGLKPMDIANWIEIDDDFDAYLAEKARLYASITDKVFVEEPESRDAQHEVRDLIADHLRRHFPDRAPTALDDGLPPLRAASMQVQEDLILMRKGADGWRLTAGSLCFPSSWTLTEKFGRPLHEIHAPVPGFGGGTRNAELIERMFDRLQGQAVERMNWSLQAGGDLYMPQAQDTRSITGRGSSQKFSDEASIARAFIRVERQTLRKLPRSGDILFTIRIYLDPLAVLARHPGRAAVARSLATQLAGLDAAQLAYKGLAAGRDRLIARLEAIAGRPEGGQ